MGNKYVKTLTLKRNIFVYYFKILYYSTFKFTQISKDLHTLLKIKNRVIDFSIIILKISLILFLHVLLLYFEVFPIFFLFVILSNETILLLGENENDEILDSGKILIKRW
jgi:hypothetical protein